MQKLLGWEVGCFNLGDMGTPSPPRTLAVVGRKESMGLGVEREMVRKSPAAVARLLDSE